MKNFLSFLISTFLLLTSVTLYAQQADRVEKALRKAVAETKGTNVAIPLMEKSKAKNKLSRAVASAITATLKTSQKEGLWSVAGLSSDQVNNIALSGSPFTSLMEMKGPSARTEFEKILGNELEKNQVYGYMEEMNRSEVLNEVALSTLIELDQNGSRLLDSIGS